MKNLDVLKKLKKTYKEVGETLFGITLNNIQDINRKLKEKYNLQYVEIEDDFSCKTTCMYVDNYRKIRYSVEIDTQDYTEKKTDILRFVVNILNLLNMKKQEALRLSIW